MLAGITLVMVFESFLLSFVGDRVGVLKCEAAKKT